MNILPSIVYFLNSNLELLGATGGGLAFLWIILQFFLDRNFRKEQAEYEKYQKLVSEFVSSETTILRKTAIAFNLRQCKRQHEFICRMFKSLIVKLEENEMRSNQYAVLVQEMKLTVSYIEKT